MFIEAMWNFGKGECICRRSKKESYRKRLFSKNTEDIHTTVMVNGSDEDYELAVKVIREAVRKYNHLSKKKMSFDVKLVNHE